MIATIYNNNSKFQVDLSKPLDISIALRAGSKNVNAWYVEPVTMEPVRTEHFIGDVNEGGSVNFRNIRFNPHGNGTHTECVGHISKEFYSVNQCLTNYFFTAEVITLTPKLLASGDRIMDTELFQGAIKSERIEALVIRTLPNEEDKINEHYSNTNPPYIDASAINYILSKGVNHLLIDLPSVDREFDEGKLISHHTFWNYPSAPQTARTITEMIYVGNHITDGAYLLNLMIAPFENDASPSKPVLYKLL